MMAWSSGTSLVDTEAPGRLDAHHVEDELAGGGLVSWQPGRGAVPSLVAVRPGRHGAQRALVGQLIRERLSTDRAAGWGMRLSPCQALWPGRLALELGGVGALDRSAQAMTGLLRRDGLLEVALMGILVGRDGVTSKL